MSALKILLVENEKITALMMQHHLQALGYQLAAIVPSGEQALAQTATLKPDLVLMDINLDSSMDGVEAAEEIQRRTDVPVVYLTSYADDETLDRAKMTGAFGYLIKPVDPASLRAAIEIAVFKHAAEKERKRLVQELQEALAQVKRLSGLLPICAQCKMIRDDRGYWSEVETYIGSHSQVMFTHGICPTCAKVFYDQMGLTPPGAPQAVLPKM